MRKTNAKNRILLAFLLETKVSRVLTLQLDDWVANEEMESISDKTDEGAEYNEDIVIKSNV